jgi:flavin reductase (DIM6/NTAB) family NADH-FMN oxidoreductase RutF
MGRLSEAMLMAYQNGQELEGLDRASGETDPAAFRRAMRELASGVTIIAAGEGERRNGCTATSVCSLSLDPPTLLACLDRGSATLATLRACGVFAISVLAADQAGLAERFAGRGGVRGASRFAAGNWTRLATGAPLLQGAAAHVDCFVEETIERHTHAIVIGRVAMAVASSARALAHWRGQSLPLFLADSGA